MNRKGFTLIEILVVIAIIGILASFLVPKLMGKPDEARIIKVKNDMMVIETALKMYKLDNGFYPTTEQGLGALISASDISPVPKKFRKSGYLDSYSEPLDAWGNEYIYRSPGEEEREYEIISFGADGTEGGEGNNSDIYNYKLK